VTKAAMQGTARPGSTGGALCHHDEPCHGRAAAMRDQP
jgi:hypothetical protein